MKQTISKLLGIAAFAISAMFGLAVSSPAQAQVYAITCLPLNNTPTWPDRDVLSCGPNGGTHPNATATTVLDAIKALNNPVTDAYAKLQAQQPSVSVFRTTAEMTTWFTERGISPPAVSNANIGGLTAEGPTGVPLYTQIFENGATPANTAVHEMGHWIDYLDRGLAPGKNRLSELPLFRSMVLQDRNAFDLLQYPFIVEPKCGVGGVFYQAKDGNNQFICSSNGIGNTLNAPTYPTSTASSDVLDIAFRDQFDLQYIKAGQLETTTFREVFAEAYAVVEGNLDSGVGGYDKYFSGTRFNCTKNFVSKVRTSGTLPTQAEIEAWGCAVPCVVWPANPGPDYPLNGHMFNCMGLPRTSAELQFQSSIMNSANAAIAGYQNDRAKLNTKNVDVYIFYNGADALISKRLDVTGNSMTDGETGRSYVEAPVGNPKLPHASSLIYVYSVEEWKAQYGKIPAVYNAIYPGTVGHELGHQMDRIWANALAYAPTSTALISLNTTNQNYFMKALVWDWAAMSAADKATLWSSYPYLMTNSTTIKNSEMFAEQTAMNNGVGRGGSSGKVFIGSALRCSMWVVTQMKNNNGVFPPAPTSGQCSGHSTW
jgi:hypothetical protein